jgi:HEAT repeat protein
MVPAAPRDIFAEVMAKLRKLDEALEEIDQLRREPDRPRVIAKLRQALSAKSCHAVAAAARVAGQLELPELAAELAAAFDRFMLNPVKSDPNCGAKTAIAEALYGMGCDTLDLFLRGVRHVQLEPVWGGKADTACDLRAASAMGLVRMNYRDVLVELADLLADPEAPVRVAAARAVAYSEDPHGIPLLRLRLLAGDQPQVVAECFTALLRLAPAASLPLVARFLDDDDPQVQELAAIALGSSRLPSAFDVLRDWWQRSASPDRRRTALTAIAMLRHDQPIDFLLSLVGEAIGPTARDAITALALYRHDPALVERVRQVIAQRKDVDLAPALAETF